MKIKNGSIEHGLMDIKEAEAVYDSGKIATVSKLLEYDIKLRQQEEQIKSLEEKVSQQDKNSQNSSKPPSTDVVKIAKKKQKGMKKRKAGGQPGHKGTHRELLPAEKVDKIIDIYPATCESCKKKLRKDDKKEPYKWQTFEIPPITPEVTEYRCHSIECMCGHENKGQLPEGVGKSNFGPRLSAIITYMIAVHHLSRRGAENFCQTLLGVNICVGSIQALLEEISNALEPADKELQDALPDAAVINSDETGWRDRWIWIFVTSTFIYFRVAISRGSKVLEEVLGESYKGILCVDRWGAYTKYHKGIMQVCWAHLKRDFQCIADIGMVEGVIDALLFAKKMKKMMGRLMALWHKYKDGKISRSDLISKSERLRTGIVKHLTAYKDSEKKAVRTLCKKLLKRQYHLFTFIFHEGVEPTNNSAERGIRPAVQWRKVCFGNRSDNGAILTGRLLTATRTCWLQRRNPLEFLVSSIAAHRAASPAPSLIYT